MNMAEMNELIAAAYEELKEEYWFVGLRFEDADREVGDICNNSRNNIDREDEREFPDFNTPEYEEMDEVNGSSAWNLNCYRYDTSEIEDVTTYYRQAHCYIVASDRADESVELLDVGEIVITDAKVMVKVF